MISWRAGCAERCTSGSEGGPGKRTGRKPDTAPRSDPYTEHPTREGKVYCCVVLDAFSRKVVGWSIDTQQNTLLVTSALTMATHERNPGSDLVIHSDRGTPSSRPGPSAKRSATPVSHHRWEPSARHTIMRWSSRSGAACKSSY